MSKDTSNQGAWIFISHSNKDFEKVRRVRNEFEEMGHKPILFFLKSIEDDLELIPLIEREIEAREWFMLCDSENARDSTYVQKEVEMIKNLEGKRYEELDLDDNWEKQKKKIHALAKRATVFISYDHHDIEIAKAITVSLLKHDFGVFLDIYLIRPGDDWRSQIAKGIEEAVDKGFFLVLLSDNTFRSDIVQHEVEYALKLRNEKKKSNIIPIFIQESISLPPSMELIIGDIQGLFLRPGFFEEDMAKLIQILKNTD